MKNLIYLLIFVMSFAACKNDDNKKNETTNPLLMKFDTQFEVPDFAKIKIEHYKPAFDEAFKQQNDLIDIIINNSEEPDFKNTIEAYEKSDNLLTKVSNVFFNIKGADTNDQMQEIANEVSPAMAAHNTNIMLNEKLFAKIKAVFEKKDNLKLNDEQKMLLSEIFNSFARGGANLEPEKKERLKVINQELSVLTLKFGENLLAENNNFKLIIDKKDDLAGLPQSIIDIAAQTATENNADGKWMFTLHKPSLIPFIQYSEKRELRKKMFEAYANMANNNDEFDNKEIINKIINLRIEKAKLFGYKNYAEYILDDRMAKNPENVYNLLNKVWEPAVKAAQNDAADFRKMIKSEGNNFKLEAWDWFYYAEKIRKEKYNFDEEQIKPYLELENSVSGLFSVVNKLYGLKIVELKDFPIYNKEVRAFEVKEADGSHVGILYMDFFTRPSKGSGAWMTEFRGESSDNGKRIAPVILTVFNFSKPAGDAPALLNFDELNTLYHEFGHALHGLLANTQYEMLSGTNVKRDFVELPSQILENWATDPQALKMFAKHYKTGETIPDELINKVIESSYFNQGFAAVEYLAASFLDLSWHTLTDTADFDVTKFETEAMNKAGLMSEIIPRYRSTYFSHIFRGGYAVGYYSYMWAEVLDADAFDAFKEKGLFDAETALAFRKNILEKGGTQDPMLLYKQFRGSEPNTDPLLKRKGFLKN